MRRSSCAGGSWLEVAVRPRSSRRCGRAGWTRLGPGTEPSGLVDLAHFSPQQCAAITAGEGPLSILAGPGSGKTTTLAGRIAHLVSERAVPPTSILAITFTTAAAAALRRRLEIVLGSTATQVDIRTFHSFGLRVIRSWSEELGFSQLPPAVYGREDARVVLREAAREDGLAVRPE